MCFLAGTGGSGGGGAGTGTEYGLILDRGYFCQHGSLQLLLLLLLFRPVRPGARVLFGASAAASLTAIARILYTHVVMISCGPRQKNIL